MKKFIASLFQGLKLFACADVSKMCGGGGGGGAEKRHIDGSRGTNRYVRPQIAQTLVSACL